MLSNANNHPVPFRMNATCHSSHDDHKAVPDTSQEQQAVSTTKHHAPALEQARFFNMFKTRCDGDVDGLLGPVGVMLAFLGLLFEPDFVEIPANTHTPPTPKSR